MKKSELVEGQRYWISEENKWKENGKGFEAIWTGYTDGLKAQFVTPDNQDTPFDVMFVHVRATFREAEDMLIHIWDRNEALVQDASTNTKRARFLGIGPDVQTTEAGVLLSQEQYMELTNLARKGLGK